MTDVLEFDPAERVRGVPLLGGLAAGVVSFLAGYLSFLIIVASTGSGLDLSRLGLSLKLTGQFFYNSFRVPTYVRETTTVEENEGGTLEIVQEVWQNAITGSRRIRERRRIAGELLEESTRSGTMETSLSFPAEVYLLVPVGILFGAGLALGYRWIDTADAPGWQGVADRSIIGGALVTLGFLLAALVATFPLTVEATQAVRRPAQVETLAFAVAYPAVFATAGLAVGQSLRSRGESSAVTDGPATADAPADDAADVGDGAAEAADGAADANAGAGAEGGSGRA